MSTPEKENPSTPIGRELEAIIRVLKTEFDSHEAAEILKSALQIRIQREPVI